MVRRLRGTLSDAGGMICDPRIVLVQSFTRIRIGFCCCTAPLFVTDCHREQVRPKSPLLFNGKIFVHFTEASHFRRKNVSAANPDASGAGPISSQNVGRSECTAAIVARSRSVKVIVEALMSFSVRSFRAGANVSSRISW